MPNVTAGYGWFNCVLREFSYIITHLKRILSKIYKLCVGGKLNPCNHLWLRQPSFTITHDFLKIEKNKNLSLRVFSYNETSDPFKDKIKCQRPSIFLTNSFKMTFFWAYYKVESHYER